jgi:hypothetical protein
VIPKFSIVIVVALFFTWVWMPGLVFSAQATPTPRSPTLAHGNGTLRSSAYPSPNYYFFPVISVHPSQTFCSTSPLPPIDWDPRLGTGPNVLPLLDKVQIVPAFNVAACTKFWRAVRVKFENIDESGGGHSIYVKIVDENGTQIFGKPIQLYAEGSGELPNDPEKLPGDPCDCNYEIVMYGDGYGVYIKDSIPRDAVEGMIMPMRRHVNYRVTFQRTTMPQ